MKKGLVILSLFLVFSSVLSLENDGMDEKKTERRFVTSNPLLSFKKGSNAIKKHTAINESWALGKIEKMEKKMNEIWTVILKDVQKKNILQRKHSYLRSAYFGESQKFSLFI